MSYFAMSLIMVLNKFSVIAYLKKMCIFHLTLVKKIESKLLSNQILIFYKKGYTII